MPRSKRRRYIGRKAPTMLIGSSLADDFGVGAGGDDADDAGLRCRVPRLRRESEVAGSA